MGLEQLDSEVGHLLPANTAETTSKTKGALL